MDSELLTGVLSLLTAAMTVYQEWRHRKLAKSKPATVHEGGPVKLSPVKRRK